VNFRLADGFFLPLLGVGFSFSVTRRGFGNGLLAGPVFSLTQAPFEGPLGSFLHDIQQSYGRIDQSQHLDALVDPSIGRLVAEAVCEFGAFLDEQRFQVFYVRFNQSASV
jgi:hypothetical protein